MGDANEEELATRELAVTGMQNTDAFRAKAEAVKEHREQEEAANKQQNNMIAESPVVAGWPDNEVQPERGLQDKVAGALAIGEAGDAALAAKLLNSGQAPLGGAAAPEQSGDGAKEKLGAVVTARGTAQAFGR